MKWDTNIDMTVQFSITGTSPWSTLSEDETNDGTYSWNTETQPDGNSYRVRIIAEDKLINQNADSSDSIFTIDNDGPSISNIIIIDDTIENTEYTKNNDNLQITATITGDPTNIEADLTGFGKGSSVQPNSYTGNTARWLVNSISCSPTDGPITIIINATDATGDSSVDIGSIIADNTDPYLIISRPTPAFYFMDSMPLLPFSYPFIIGQITIIGDATDDGSGIDKVEFYLEDSLESTANEQPYSWLWDEAATGFFDIELIAYDIVGNTATDELRDLFIIN